MSSDAATPKPAAKKVAKKPAKPSQHPTVSVMVKAAITSLKEKKGSSLSAIKKYIETNYKGIDMKRHGPFIRRFLKKSVADKSLVQIKGSFKLGAKPKAEKKAKTVKKPAAKKPKKAKTPKKGCCQEIAEEGRQEAKGRRQEASCQETRSKEARSKEASCQETSSKEASCQETSSKEASCQEDSKEGRQEVNHYESVCLCTIYTVVNGPCKDHPHVEKICNFRFMFSIVRSIFFIPNFVSHLCNV